MCTYIYTRLPYTYAYVYTYTCTYIFARIFMYIHMHTHHAHTHTRARVHAHTHAYVHVYMQTGLLDAVNRHALLSEHVQLPEPDYPSEVSALVCSTWRQTRVSICAGARQKTTGASSTITFAFRPSGHGAKFSSASCAQTVHPHLCARPPFLPLSIFLFCRMPQSCRCACE